jgi:hypothetical protein
MKAGKPKIPMFIRPFCPGGLFSLGFFCLAVFAFAQDAAAPETRQTPAAEASDFEILQNKGGGVTITAYKGESPDVVIPAEIGGGRVTVLGPRSFYARDIQSVTIPEGVLTIAYGAFAKNRLSSLVLPQSLNSIEYEAFADNRITTLELPENLRSLGVRSFAGNDLDSVTIGRRLTFIGQGAFAGNKFSRVAMAEGRNLFTSQGFELSFVNYYQSTGKRAGVYTKNGRVWSLREEQEE